MTYRYFRDSGMTARDGAPSAEEPWAWVAWHFTHIDNLPSVVTAGGLLAANHVTPITNVAATGIKARRALTAVDPDPGYPTSVVNDHVPFYLAPKSPMLFVVDRGHAEYQGGCEPLIFLGCMLGDVLDSGRTWCVSDGNAAANYTSFSRDLDQLGAFVDFPLLCQRDWYNTPEDGDRKRRRAAELLVHDAVPLGMVSVVAARTEPMLARARAVLESVGGERHYVCMPGIYY